MFDGPLSRNSMRRNGAPALRLARSARIGPVTFHEALGHFGSARAACAQLATISEAESPARNRRLTAPAGGSWCSAIPPIRRRSPPCPTRRRSCRRSAISACSAGHAGDRRRARGLAGRPAVRRRLAADLGDAGFVIVSGLARGIDAAAHGPPCRPVRWPCWPAASTRSTRPARRPAGRIAERGLLLAETPLGTPPIARSFPRRNRIVSGLSAGVVVIEAADRSGSLITAQRALEQGREVFVVPGSPMDPRYAGSNTLIRDGAILVRDANDIISVFGRPQFSRQPVEKPRKIPTRQCPGPVRTRLGTDRG